MKPILRLLSIPLIFVATGLAGIGYLLWVILGLRDLWPDVKEIWTYIKTGNWPKS